jgi:hypothetical protein
MEKVIWDKMCCGASEGAVILFNNASPIKKARLSGFGIFLSRFELHIFVFPAAFTFTTCGVYSAPIGPNQKDCDEAYEESADSDRSGGGGGKSGSPRVLIGDEERTRKEPHQVGHVTGIQRWRVPRTDIYT